MKNLSIKDILNVTKGRLIIGNEEQECKTFSKDTRSIKKGDCYIGIKGATFDGSKFWRQALENGANCVIVENIDFTEDEKKEFDGKAIIKVENTLESLYKIASYKKRRF